MTMLRLARISATFVVLLLVAASVQAQEFPGDPVAWWTFDRPLSDRFTMEQVSRKPTQIQSPFHVPELIEGPHGMALRLDGYSTWLAWELPEEQAPREALTVAAWIALEAYPVAKAPFVGQYRAQEAGFFFGVDPWGAWSLSVAVDSVWHTCRAENPFPKNTWVHAAGTFDGANGALTVYLNGEPVCTTDVPPHRLTVATDATLVVGRDPATPTIGAFETALINGAVDEVKVHDRALSTEEVRAAYQDGDPLPAALDVPPDRFADDMQRPRYHPMPPAQWANESHGMVYHDGAYHLFYQKNPNGPYWEQIHWGHLTSTDLIHWNEQPMALAPEPGWDQRGIWAGDAVVNDGRLTLVYTGVDGVKAGIGLAVEDPETGAFTKYPGNPVVPAAPEGSMDFRDPYLWQEGDTWHMIIGSGRPGEGGTVFHYTSADLVDWTFHGSIFSGDAATSGMFWEVPVLLPMGAEKHVLALSTVEDQAPARYLYWVGTWDGRRFTPDHDAPRQLDLINHFLSPAVLDATDGRTLAVGIITERRTSEAQLEAGWAQGAFSLPREWRLCDDGTLCQQPAAELERLRRAPLEYESLNLVPDSSGYLPKVDGMQMELRVELELGDAEQAGVVVRQSPDGREQTRIFYDATTETINLDLRASTLSSTVFQDVKQLRSAHFPLQRGESLTLQVFVDRSILEIFVNDRAAFATRIYPSLGRSTGVDLFSRGGAAVAHSVDAWALKAISGQHD